MDNNTKWEIISELCAKEGVELFDIDFAGNVVRVYITAKSGIQHSHCSAVSHQILDHHDVEKILPGNTLLEVSSPGVNRKLTRPEHFNSAVGERLKLSYKDSEGKKNTITCKLESVNESFLTVVPEAKLPAPIQLARSSVVDAKVDFKF
jgi:ribosome maturation factor RimP